MDYEVHFILTMVALIEVLLGSMFLLKGVRNGK